MKRILYFFLALTFLVVAQANADVVRNAGTTQYIIGITGYATYGDNMTGMSVTANFSRLVSQTVFWQATGSGSGAATGTNWSLSLSGDSFDSSWLLSNFTGDTMTSVLINPFPGNTVFDTLDSIDYPAMDTPNSERGSAQFDDPLRGTYTNLVGVTGDASSPYGDLYQYLEVTFSSNGLGDGGTASWIADTDTIGLVPIPGAVWLLGSGLLGLGGWRSVRKG